MEANYEEGIWLGHARVSNEVLMSTKEGAERAISIKGMPQAEKWSEPMLEGKAENGRHQWSRN